jgi:hypothetical protein
MIIRAGEDIPEGNKITRRYTWSPSFYHRRRGLSKYFDECDCKLCEDDRADDPELRSARDRLLQDAHEIIEDLTVTRAQDLVKDIQLTYSTSRRTNLPGLAYAYKRLADVLFDHCHRGLKQGYEQYKDIIRANIFFLEASGTTVLDKGMESCSEAIGDHRMPISDKKMPHISQEGEEACINIAFSFFALGLRSRVKMWLRAAIWSMCI